jgi:hypothetical protein
MSSKDSQENTESQEVSSQVTVLGAGYCARVRTTEDGQRLRVGFFYVPNMVQISLRFIGRW